MNTGFRKSARHLYTWKSPGDLHRSEIDHFTVNNRFRNAVTNVRTFPGSDLGRGCDHVPVVAWLKLWLKKVKRARGKRRNWEELSRVPSKLNEFQAKFREKYDGTIEQKRQPEEQVVEKL